MLARAIALLTEAQRELNAIEDAEIEEYGWRARPDFYSEPDWRSRLFFADIGERLAIEFYGQNYEAQWECVQEAIASPDVAPHVALLRLNGPDEGANGLRSWDFETLIGLAPRFPQLTHFHIEPTEPAHHNSSVVEDDQTPQLLALMPALRRLVLPQAPEPAFFSLPFDDLRYLRIGMEHRTRGFIRTLATSGLLPELVTLDFADSVGPWLSTEEQPAEWTSTPFDDYEALLKSTAVPNMKVLFLRNATLTEAQFRSLQDLRSDLQFAVILSPPHVYVKHWGTTEFPYRHMLPRDEG